MNHIKFFFNFFFKKEEASVSVETVLTLPILILMITTSFELFTYFLVQNKLMRFAGSVGNLVSQAPLSGSKLTAILESSLAIMDPFLQTPTMIVSQIRGDTKTMSWQKKNGPLTSLVGQPGFPPGNLPGNLVLSKTQSVIITEVFLTHRPVIFKGFFPDQSFYKVSVFVPRVGSMNMLLEG